MKLTTHDVMAGPALHATLYAVSIDGETFCYTTNDNEGMALAVAIARLELQRKMEGKAQCEAYSKQ